MAKTQKTSPNLQTPLTGSAPLVPWSEKSKADRLSDLADMGLEQSRRILAIDVDPSDLSRENLKLMSIVSNVALTVLSTQVKVDSERLRASRDRYAHSDFLDDLERATGADGGEE